MDNFEKLVKKCQKKKKLDIIRNSSVDHAKVLVKQLFNEAIENKKDIRIISGTLNADFYDSFTDDVKKVLTKNKVTILVVTKCESSQFSEIVAKSGNGKIISLDGRSDLPKIIPHFMVVGETSYRLEKNDKYKTGIASFNDEDIARYLIDRHSSIIEVNDEITETEPALVV